MTKKNYHIILDIIATAIIALAVILTIIVGYNYLKFPSPKIQTIKIEYHGIKTDSVNSLNKLEIKKIDSLLKEIKTTSNKIQQAQMEVVEKKSDDSFYNKFYTAIVAIILALAGFFGFKSISEVKTQAIEDAKKESTRVAKKVSPKIAREEFTRIFDTEYQAGVSAIANETMTNFLRVQIGTLEDRISLLEELIINGGGDNKGAAQNNDNPDYPIILDAATEEIQTEQPENLQADNLVEPENPFDNE
jgi:hypothetical protein